jgi:hypothetical protein
MFYEGEKLVNEDYRKEAMDDYFDTDSPTNHLQPNTICDLFCHSNQLEYI